jgi:hypothetical protein
LDRLLFEDCFIDNLAVEQMDWLFNWRLKTCTDLWEKAGSEHY